MEELARPHETSPETEEFINGVKKQEIEPASEPEVQKKQKKTKAAKKEKDKTRHTFIVSDGAQTIEVDGLNHKGAALSVTSQFAGTEDQPVRVKVTDQQGGEERQYDTFNEERESTRGKKFMAPRLKAVV